MYTVHIQPGETLGVLFETPIGEPVTIEIVGIAAQEATLSRPEAESTKVGVESGVLSVPDEITQSPGYVMVSIETASFGFRMASKKGKEGIHASDVIATDVDGSESDVQTMLSQSLPASKFTVGDINGTGGVLGPASGGTGVTSLNALFSALGLTNFAKCVIYNGQVNVTIPAGRLYASSAFIPFGVTLSSFLALSPNIMTGNPANKFASLSPTTTGVTVNAGISATSTSATVLTIRWFIIGQK